MAVQLTVALVVVMLEELKPVGMPQLAAVVNDVAVLYELDPDPPEQTVWTWNWYAVPAVSPVKLREVVVMLLTVVHVDEDEAFHWRLYLTAPETAVQLTVALVVVMLEEVKPVGVPHGVNEPKTCNS